MGATLETLSVELNALLDQADVARRVAHVAILKAEFDLLAKIDQLSGDDGRRQYLASCRETLDVHCWGTPGGVAHLLGARHPATLVMRRMLAVAQAVVEGGPEETGDVPPEAGARVRQDGQARAGAPPRRSWWSRLFSRRGTGGRRLSEMKRLEGHESQVECLGVSPDGRLAATADVDVRLWDMPSGRQAAHLPRQGDPFDSLAFSPSGALLACAPSGKERQGVVVLDVPTLRERAALVGHTDSVHHVLFGADDGTLLSAALDGTVRIWDVAAGKERARLAAMANDMALLGEGDLLLTTDAVEGGALWDLRTGSVTRKYPTPGNDVAVSPDGSLAAFSFKTDCTLWDIASGKQVGSLDGHGEEVSSMAFSPDGTLLLSGDLEGMLRLWDVASRRELCRRATNEHHVTGMAFLADGRHVLTTGETVRLWGLA